MSELTAGFDVKYSSSFNAAVDLIGGFQAAVGTPESFAKQVGNAVEATVKDFAVTWGKQNP